mgnify:FL=1
MAWNASVEGYVVLTVIFEKEGNQFTAYCRELGTPTCGDTIEEALANLEEAIQVHIEGLRETGELERFFKGRHVRIDMMPPMNVWPPTEDMSLWIRPRQIATAFPFRVPVLQGN